ncbi:MAG: acetyltransferase [Chitinophagaceae bacterium]|nr:MAG: acetyltransferase [Chitinophagaceae bacterium]
MENPVIILGAKQLGTVALDIFKSHDVLVYCLLDDDAALHNTEVNDIMVMGNTDDEEFLKVLGKKCEAFIAVEDQKHRKVLLDMLVDDVKVMPVNAIHNAAVVSEDAELGHGNLIAAGAIIGTKAKVGQMNIVHARALVDHFATVGNNVSVGAGAIINANAVVKDNAFIGSGAIIISGVTIGKKARIGAGSVVIADVADGATVFGNPAAEVK